MIYFYKIADSSNPMGDLVTEYSDGIELGASEEGSLKVSLSADPNDSRVLILSYKPKYDLRIGVKFIQS